MQCNSKLCSNEGTAKISQKKWLEDHMNPLNLFEHKQKYNVRHVTKIYKYIYIYIYMYTWYVLYMAKATISLNYIKLVTHVTLYCIVLYQMRLRCVTLHYITLHYIALHCIALHYITLHYMMLGFWKPKHKIILLNKGQHDMEKN